MIRYKNVLYKLKNAGYSLYRIRKDNIMSESTVQKIRENKYVSLKVIDTICHLLDCQPNDIIEIIKDDNVIGIKNQKNKLT